MSKYLKILIFAIAFSLGAFAASAAQADIDAGRDYCAVLLADGSILSYGRQFDGIDAVDDAASISAGYDHIAVLHQDGTVSLLGDVDQGGVPAWENVVSIKAGQDFTYGVTCDGEILFSGTSSYPSALPGAALSLCSDAQSVSVIAIAACSDSGAAVIEIDGEKHFVISSGNEYYQNLADSWSGRDIVDLSCTDDFIVGVCSDGSLLYCGSDGSSRFVSWSDVAAFSSYGSSYAAVTASGRVRVFSDWESDEGADSPSSMRNIVDVALSRDAIYMLDSDGTVYVSYEQMPKGIAVRGLNVNFTKNLIPSPVPKVVAGMYSTAALTEDGEVLYAGFVNSSIPAYACAGWEDVVDIAMDERARHIVGLKSDGSVVAAGLSTSGQTNVSTWSRVARIYAAETYSAALTVDGRVFVTTKSGLDEGEKFQFDIENGSDRWRNIKKLYCGSDYIVGIDYTGAAHVMKMLSAASLEIGGAGDLLTDAAYFDSGYRYSLFVGNDGAVTAFTSDKYINAGQADVSSMTDIVKVSAGYNHTLALTQSGAVIAIGSSSNGKTNIELGRSAALDVAAGYFHSAVLLDDGRVVCFGSDSFGQLDTSDWRLFRLEGTEITPPDPISVDFGTDAADIDLPDSVFVVYDGYSRLADALWDLSSYNKYVYGAQAVTGELSIDGSDFSGSVELEINVGSPLVYNSKSKSVLSCSRYVQGSLDIAEAAGGEVRYIENEAFYECSDLAEVIIPDTVVSIGTGAFYGCASLEYIIVPQSVTGMSEYTFAECPSISYAVFYENTPVSTSTFTNSPVIYTSTGSPASSTAARCGFETRPLRYVSFEGNSLVIANFEENDFSCTLLCSVYNGGGATVAVSRSDYYASFARYVSSYELDADFGAYSTAKYFIWESLDSLSPICDAITVTKYE